MRGAQVANIECGQTVKIGRGSKSALRHHIDIPQILTSSQPRSRLPSLEANQNRSCIHGSLQSLPTVPTAQVPSAPEKPFVALKAELIVVHRYEEGDSSVGCRSTMRSCLYTGYIQYLPRSRDRRSLLSLSPCRPVLYPFPKLRRFSEPFIDQPGQKDQYCCKIDTDKCPIANR
jgi:hypothetical protein